MGVPLDPKNGGPRPLRLAWDKENEQDSSSENVEDTRECRPKIFTDTDNNH